ncbi:collagen alpha-1(I) chain-like [Mustela erminea]|uniref:collagen alpha-1(I) chain-like n=1 Tax=Mustela erminea TaxID=36723 RepID=UPI0013872D1B|nr:collagen alpha-1(I) chain-like [Mustela erminea]XP_032172329.1 collagen alpha-1(I) chain-like [Mustela erminea]XP_032172330.1 collagen alpha-1(I) chain-like [Mustela erminea]
MGRRVGPSVGARPRSPRSRWRPLGKLKGWLAGSVGQEDPGGLPRGGGLGMPGQEEGILAVRRAEHSSRDQTTPLSYEGLTGPVLCWARTQEKVMDDRWGGAWRKGLGSAWGQTGDMTLTLPWFTRGEDAGRGRRRNSVSREARPRAAGRCVCTLSVTESAWPQGLRGAGTAQEARGGPGAGEVLPERSRWSPAERPGQETRVWNQMAQEGEQGGCGRGCLGLEPGGPGGRGCRPLPAPPRGLAARPAAHSLCSSRPAFSSQSPRLFGLRAQLSSLPGWPLCPRASRGPLPLALSPTSPPLRGLSRQPPLRGGSGPVWSELCSLVCRLLCPLWECEPLGSGWLVGGPGWESAVSQPQPGGRAVQNGPSMKPGAQTKLQRLLAV